MEITLYTCRRWLLHHRAGGDPGLLNVFGRGYSLTRKVTALELLREAGTVRPGECVVTCPCHGQRTGVVEIATREVPNDGRTN
jgi:hypothetical protein